MIGLQMMMRAGPRPPVPVRASSRHMVASHLGRTDPLRNKGCEGALDFLQVTCP